MGNETKARLTHEVIQRASLNYVDCLNLPKNSGVILIGDAKITKPNHPSPNTLARQSLSETIDHKLRKNDNLTVAQLEFSDLTEFDDFQSTTRRAIDEIKLQTKGPITVVMLCGDFTWRNGIYSALLDAVTERPVRLATSMGMTIDQITSMAELTDKKRHSISQGMDNFSNYLKNFPTDQLSITTKSSQGKSHSLQFGYDISEKQHSVNKGWFESAQGESVRGISQITIPGGDIRIPSHPNNSLEGKFSANGIIFTVKKGRIVKTNITDESSKNILTSDQRHILQLISEGRLEMSVADLGIGFYNSAFGIYSEVGHLSGANIGIGPDAAYAREIITEDRIKKDKPVFAQFDLDQADIEFTKSGTKSRWYNT